MPSIRSVSRALITVGAAATIVAAGAAPASAVAIGEPACDTTPPPVAVCVREVENGPQIPVAAILGADLNAEQLAHVVGYLDYYDVPTGPTSNAVIPCVITVVNGQTTDRCADLGLQQTAGRDPIPLVDGTVDSYSPTVTRLVDLYVCEARITATVAGFGEPDRPIATLCYDIDPIEPIWVEDGPEVGPLST
ncbi:MAG TPA: hypothetical protein VNA20_08525 [Frankiaceae bacterium]|nr:hypothetical protein [Frankiaceae bacterium]